MSELKQYGFIAIGSVALADDHFVIEVRHPEAGSWEEAIYAFEIEGEIVRVGSSKGALARRFDAWQRDVTKAIQGRKSPTPLCEAEEWRRRLERQDGQVWARQGTEVRTPLGFIRAYLDEERVLIARDRPPLNRSHR